MVIDELFEALSADEGKKVISYGRELQVTESQTKVLVALSHVFPNRFIAALELVELGACSVYRSNHHKVIVVDSNAVSLILWSCPCSDFLRQVIATPRPKSRWDRVCKHLLAAFLVDHRVPIFDYAEDMEIEVPLSDMTKLSFQSMK